MHEGTISASTVMRNPTIIWIRDGLIAVEMQNAFTNLF